MLAREMSFSYIWRRKYVKYLCHLNENIENILLSAKGSNF